MEIGEQVIHNLYGPGIITEFVGDHDAVVNFERLGVKTVEKADLQQLILS